MKNNLDPVGNLLTNSAIFAFCLMFLVLLITLTGCGANQTGAADAATTTEDTMSVGGHVSLQDTEPLEAESVVPESLSCAEFRERIATIYTGNYHAGGWDGTPVAVTHEDHEHIIELFYSQTIVIDDVIYGDINLPAGASMSMCIKQGQERTYLQGPDRMINAYHAGEMVASYANPQGYYLCMLLQSPADDAKYLIAKEDGYVATSTLAVLNLETGDWQELSTAWADGEYWFSETGKTLFYQNIDGQAYKFDLALAITAPQKIAERYTGEYWDGSFYTNWQSILRAVGPDHQREWFIRNLADFGDYGYAHISSHSGIVRLIYGNESTEILRLWPSEWAADDRYCDVLDSWVTRYDGDDPEIPSLELAFLAQTHKLDGSFSLDVYRLGLKPDGEHYDAKIENITSGAYGNAYLRSDDGYLYFNCESQYTLLIKDLKEAVRTHTYEYVHGGK